MPRAYVNSIGSKAKSGDFTVDVRRVSDSTYRVLEQLFHGILTKPGVEVGYMARDSDGEWFYRSDCGKIKMHLGYEWQAALGRLRKGYNGKRVKLR